MVATYEISPEAFSSLCDEIESGDSFLAEITSFLANFSEPAIFINSDFVKGEKVSFVYSYVKEKNEFICQCLTYDYRATITASVGAVQPPWVKQALIRIRKEEYPSLTYEEVNQALCLGGWGPGLQKFRISVRKGLTAPQKKTVDKFIEINYVFALKYVMLYNALYSKTKIVNDVSDHFLVSPTKPKGETWREVIVKLKKERYLSSTDDEDTPVEPEYRRRHGEHEVRGSWVYRQAVETSEDCTHAFQDAGRQGLRQRCTHCGQLRWWRAEHKRGDPSLGIIHHTGFRIE